MQRPKITVVTISYNSAKTIERTIQSVVSQSYERKEYVIIDGDSSDGTQDIVRKYASQVDVFVSEKDSGRSDAFNKGLRLATGDLVVYINSDDYLLPDSLSRVADIYDGTADFYCGNLLLWDDKTDHMCQIKPSLSFPTMPFFRRPVHQGVFATKHIYEKLGGYDTRIKYAMDLDLLMRATRQGAKFRHVDIDIAVFRLGGATEDSIFKKKEEYIYIVRKNGGSTFQAYLFYLFLVVTQTGKKLLQKSGIDVVRRLRYKKRRNDD